MNKEDCNSENSDWRKCINKLETQSFERYHWESKMKVYSFYHHQNKFNQYSPHVDRFGILIKSKDNDKYLLVKQTSNGFYGAPKGSQQQNENPELCAQRETMEETGGWVEIEDIKKGIVIHSRPEEKFEQKNYTFYHLQCESPFLCNVDGQEINAYAWMAKEEICKTRKASFTNNLFQKVFECKQDIPLVNIRVPIITKQDKQNRNCHEIMTNHEFFSNVLSLKERNEWKNWL